VSWTNLIPFVRDQCCGADAHTNRELLYPMRILVLDGDQNQAVACVRSLALGGHTVFAGESRPWSKASWSRFSAGSCQYASPQLRPSQFLDDLLAECQKERGTLVLPMTEASTLVISAHRDRFAAANARLVLPSHADLLRAVDKRLTTDLAQSLGMVVPKTATVQCAEPIPAAVQNLRFPVVLKPRTSQEVAQSKMRATGRPSYARDFAQLEQSLTDMQQRCSSVLVQEFIEGAGAGYFALMNHGEVRAEFAHRRIRDLHPTGSGSALRESVPISPNIREMSLAMLRALNWHGVAMIEFRIRQDGVPVFLEVNGRFWHSLPLAYFAGTDFPALLAHMAEFGDVEPPPGFRTGVRCRWLVGDFRHLIEVWKGPPPGYPGFFPGRWSTLLAELTPRLGTFHDNFMWHDPLPELGDWIRLVRQIRERNV
jgi:predicted ATP-grasp superfamily ATP-dependent carboligase